MSGLDSLVHSVQAKSKRTKASTLTSWKKMKSKSQSFGKFKGFLFSNLFSNTFFSLWSSFADLFTSQPSSYLIPSLQPCIVHSVLNFVIELAQQI